MERINPTAPSDTKENSLIMLLREHAPEAFADGKLNLDVLQQLVSNQVEDEEMQKEHFGLNWAGKTKARRIAMQKSIGSTLKPVPREGIDEDTTQHVFIEGDNLEVLKLLRETYADKIKMIYIDPPYNTGQDFIYKDDFAEPLDTYLRRTGQKEGEQLLVSNPKSQGRFHANWLNFMYPRLRVAKDLLSSDGIIFVSIDDNEVHHLRALMNEIFGEENLLANFVWRTDGNFDNQAKVKNCHEYVLAYAKKLESFPAPPAIDPNINKNSKLFNSEIRNTIVKNGPKNPQSDIILPIGFPADFENGDISAQFDKWPKYFNDAKISNYILTNETIVNSGWSSKELLLDFIKGNFKPIIDSKGQETTFIISKTGAIESIKQRSSSQSHVISVLTNLGNTQSTSAYLEDFDIYFDYPKPLNLIKYLIQMIGDEEFIVLDFFAGSGTTAEAVMELNKDGKKRKYICVQLPVKVNDKDEAGKKSVEQGLFTIADIARERIKRVSTKLQSEGVKGDVGFKVFKLGASNYKPWKDYQGNNAAVLTDLFTQIANSPLVDEWQPKELLTEIILLEGFPLHSQLIALDEYSQNDVISVSSNFSDHKLIICLDAVLHAKTIVDLKISKNDIFICLDSALTDQAKLQLDDKLNLKTI